LDKVARIVGGISPKWGEIAKKLYQSITTEEVLQVSNIKTAEAAKIIENIQRDLNIALMNEIALIFERMNIDIIEVIDAAATKWNFVKVYPGAGVGGHCLPVDPYYLTHKAKELGYYPKVILAGREINDFMPTHIVNLIVDGLSEVNKVVAHSKIAILGVSYKANTEDLRNSPGIEIVKILLEMGGDVCIHDPLVEDEIFLKDIGLQNEKMERVLNGADCITITIAHDQFKKLKIDDIANCVNPMGVLVDAAHIFDPKKVIEKQIVYRGVGRVGND
jgi:nucleotide sugar dehydrogenase